MKINKYRIIIRQSEIKPACDKLPLKNSEHWRQQEFPVRRTNEVSEELKFLQTMRKNFSKFINGGRFFFCGAFLLIDQKKSDKKLLSQSPQGDFAFVQFSLLPKPPDCPKTNIVCYSSMF